MRCWACAGMLRRGRAPIPAHRQAAAAHQDAPPCGFAGGVLEKGDKYCPWPARNDAAMAACAKKITAAPRWRPSGRGAHAAFRETGREAAPCPAAGFARRVLPSRHAFFSGVRGQKTPCAVSAVWPSVSAGIRAFLFFCLSAARLWAAGGKAAGKAPLGLVPRLRIAYPLSNLWDLTPAAGALPCAGPQRPAPVRALRRAVLYGRARGRPPYKGAAVRPLGGNAFFLSLLVTEWMIS